MSDSAYAYIAYTERAKTLPAAYFDTIHYHTFSSLELRDTWLTAIATNPLLETFGLQTKASDTEPVYLNTASDETADDEPDDIGPFVISVPPNEDGLTCLILQAAEELGCLLLTVPDWDTSMSKQAGKDYLTVFHQHFDPFAPLWRDTIAELKTDWA